MTRILYRSQNGKCDLILFWTLLLKRCLCTIVYTNELDLDTINNYRSHLHTPLCVYWVTFTHSEFALLCMGVELLCQYEAMYLHDRFRCCTKVFPQMFVGCIDRFMRTVKWAKFGDMLFFHSWKRVHVHSFNCFQMCALASQPLSLPFSFAFISHRPLPRSELSSTSSSPPHPVCHQLWAQTEYACRTTLMTWSEIVLFVWISQNSLLIQKLQTTVGSWGWLFALLRWNSTVKQRIPLLQTHTPSLSQSICPNVYDMSPILMAAWSPFTVTAFIPLLSCAPPWPLWPSKTSQQTQTHTWFW